MTIGAAIETYLVSLGKTSEEVAESLRQQGIQGIKKSARCCAIVNGAYQAVPGATFLCTEKFNIYYNGHKQYANLPHPVLNFIQDFDDGKYPDLEM